MKHVIDEQFDVPRLPVSIAALPNCDWETQAMRAVLEGFGCVVTVHWVGAPNDFLKLLSQGETAPRYLLIAGHGDEEKGYYFGSYADFIDTSMLRDEYLPAEAIAPVVNLPGCTVISSACTGGIEAMGRAFTRAGKLEAYTGCRDYPDGSDMLLYTVNFFYGLVRRKLSVHEAWKWAIKVTDQPEIYQISYFHADGTEERYEQAAEEGNR